MTRYKIRLFNKNLIADFETNRIFRDKDDSKEITLKELNCISKIRIYDEKNQNWVKSFVKIDEYLSINELKTEINNIKVNTKKKIDDLEQQLEYYKSLSEL